MLHYKSKSGKISLKSVESLIKTTYIQTFFMVTAKGTEQSVTFRLWKHHGSIMTLDSITQENGNTKSSTIFRCDVDSMSNANLPVMFYATDLLTYNVAKQFERYLFRNFSKRT